MRLLFLDEVDSTQRVAIEQVQRGERAWDAICADHQTAGRGRRGARWHDEPGTSLLVSFLLWDVPLPDPPGLLGIAAAIAAAETLEQAFPPLQVRLKYPNDLILQGRKLGGVLVEIVEETAIVGVGINLAQREFPEPLRESAISVWQGLSPEKRKEFALDLPCPGPYRALRAHLIEGIGKRLKELAMQVASSGATLLHPLWQARDDTGGRIYQILDVPGRPVGIALRVEPDFRLRLRLPDSSEHATYLVTSIEFVNGA
ncbi:Bifunctional ligase/repressor BirA [bacterium HR15]|nr:Bifunctional ligase/repressor BirA [bacterium HR15]